MGKLFTATWVGVAVLLAGCGGRAEKEGPEPQEPGESSPTGSTEQSEQEGSSPGSWDAGTALGECNPGFDSHEQPERSCNWMVDGRCFEDKLDACACACPRKDGLSNCFSDFPGENARVEVYCY